ncbi:hypothetical protein BC643_4059 [Mangrovibacterium diazotrophicum]|uniref:Uncharacterized protein n=1 Tax=Mangrovibacterium diazotrophicum TaxID=1261403 RepID=A0A419VW75_9BACT|nr:hypothetical protein BC643_4059 [Mangrovibacterium diazotrophicum]
MKEQLLNEKVVKVQSPLLLKSENFTALTGCKSN